MNLCRSLCPELIHLANTTTNLQTNFFIPLVGFKPLTHFDALSKVKRRAQIKHLARYEKVRDNFANFFGTC